ncbi:MAG: 3-oxoacyl-[acyl-carrier-protein] reductase [Simkaniaceae bacterium]
MKLKNKRALVTGGAKGIGREISVTLAKEGAEIAVSYRTGKEEALKLQKEILEGGGKCHIFYGDFQTEEDVKNFFNDVLKQLGAVDIVINNAGISGREDLFELSGKNLEHVFSVNVVVPFLFTKEAALHMKENNIAGSIINISSIAGIITSKGKIAYSVSKAALNMLTKKSAVSLAPFGIRVNAVAPGVIAAGMNEKAMQENKAKWEKKIQNIPLQRPGTPADEASAVAFLASEEASWITGHILVVDGGHCLFFEI